jgi:hypothetical protein
MSRPTMPSAANSTAGVLPHYFQAEVVPGTGNAVLMSRLDQSHVVIAGLEPAIIEPKNVDAVMDHRTWVLPEFGY